MTTTSSINRGLMTSDRPDWCTPANVLSLVREFAPILLDPCSGPGSIVAAEIEWTGDPWDGLALPWRRDGTVYVNPPYGEAIKRWAFKMGQEGANGCEIIALLPARTDTTWWQTHVTLADAVCFWAGRLRFLGAPSSAPFPSAVAYWGPQADRFTRVFWDSGWIVTGARRPRCIP